MPEYIERDIFINNELIPLVKQLDLCHPKQKKGVLMAIQKLNEAPTADVVEVVRCKDCKYQDDCARQMVHTTRDYVLEQNISTYNKVDYCSYGELKEREGK